MNLKYFLDTINVALKRANKTASPRGLVYLEQASKQLSLLREQIDSKQQPELYHIASRVQSLVWRLERAHSENAEAKAQPGK